MNLSIKNNNRKNKIYKFISISYSLAFFVPLLIACIGFIFLISLLNNRVSEINRLALYQIKEITDANLSNILSISKLVIRNNEIQNLKNNTNSIIHNNLLTCLKLKDELNIQMQTNNLIESINVTFNSSSSIISSDGFFHKPDNYDQEFNIVNLNYSQWQELSSFLGFSNITMQTTKENSKKIFIVYKDNNQINIPNAVIVTIILNTERVQSLLETLKLTDESRALILDQFGRLDASNASNHTLVNTAFDSIGYNTIDYNKKSINIINNNMTNYVPSAVAPWMYLLTTPYSVYYEQIIISLAILIGYIILCGFAGALLIPRSIKHSYSPINRLVNTMKSQLEPNSVANPKSANQDEYAIIEEGLANLLNKILHNEEKLSEHEKVLADNALRQIITGRVRKDNEIRSILEYHKISLPNPNYSTMLFSIEDYGELGFREDESSLDIIHYIIASSISEIVQTKYPCQIFDIDYFSVCIVNLELKSTTDDLLDIATKANTFIKNKFNISLSTSIGRIVKSITKIHFSYQDALVAIDYIKTVGLKNQVIVYDTIVKTDSINQGWVDFSEHHHQFMNLMLADNYREAYSLINSMIENDFNANIKMKMTSLITTVVMAINKITPYPADIFSTENSPINALYEVNSLPGLKSAIETIFISLINYSDHKKMKEPSRQDEIIAYVKQHYRNPDLNVSSIAEYFDISISYVSRLFKNLTGTGLLDYVHYLRIEDAKHLLKTSKKSIKNIATEVGYYNSLTMARAFRRYEGVTPSDFRGIQY